MVILLPAGVATKEVLTPLAILYERLAMEVVWAGRRPGRVPGHDPPMSFHAEVALAEVASPPELLLLPGGFGSLEIAFDGPMLRELRRLISPTTVCLAISTGSLPLAAAGLLTGQRVTGHWLSYGYLRRFGAVPVSEQLVTAGRIITASGSVSAEFAARFAADLVSYGPPAASLHSGQGSQI
jgi:putative intracellular protease/amidase